MNPLQFTEERRQEIFLAGQKSLLYFGVSILGFDAWDETIGGSALAPVHVELSAFLEGRPPFKPWNRGLVCTSRGLGKSTWTSMIYPWWRAAYGENFVVKLVEGTSKNAKDLHFLPMVDLWVSSKRADFLQWLFQDRLPKDGVNSWNSTEVFFRRSKAVPPSISYWGIESKFEGAHPDLMVLDDLDGADAEKSILVNETSWATYLRCIPMLRDPRFSQILVVGTPWGTDPLVYRLRNRPSFQVFWREIIDEEGKSRWPVKFPEWTLKQLQETPEIWDTQFMLRKSSKRRSIFAIEKVKQNFYKVPAPGIVEYDTFEFDPDNVSEAGTLEARRVHTYTTLQECRHYVHLDPLHRTEDMLRSRAKKPRPAKAGITVCSVAPDGHVFVTETWEKDADLAEQVEQAFKYYCLYAAHWVTYESIGAQAWIPTFVKTLEKMNTAYRNPRCPQTLIQTRWDLPRMSERMVEAAKKIESKEMLFRESLSPWLNAGVLHLHKKQERLVYQLENVEDESIAVDLIDSLTQGSGAHPDDNRPIWRPPILSAAGARALAARQKHVEMAVHKKTGYFSPWR